MFNHFHLRSVFLTLLALSSVSAAQAALQDTALPTFQTTVSEVRVTFFATDENDQPITSLTNSDFAVVDAGQVLRQFRSFRRSTETALDIVVLVDASQSVGPRFQFAMNDVAQIVAREQSIPDDQISVISFGGIFPANGTPSAASASLHPAVLCASGCRTSNSISNLQALESSSVTPLFDTLVFGADFMSHHRRPGTRPVLILFSDGNDTISMHSSRDAVQAVTETGALVYSHRPRKPQTANSRQSVPETTLKSHRRTLLLHGIVPADKYPRHTGDRAQRSSGVLRGHLRSAESSRWISRCPSLADSQP